MMRVWVRYILTYCDIYRFDQITKVWSMVTLALMLCQNIVISPFLLFAHHEELHVGYFGFLSFIFRTISRHQPFHYWGIRLLYIRDIRRPGQSSFCRHWRYRFVVIIHWGQRHKFTDQVIQRYIYIYSRHGNKVIFT